MLYLKVMVVKVIRRYVDDLEVQLVDDPYLMKLTCDYLCMIPRRKRREYLTA